MSQERRYIARMTDAHGAAFDLRFFNTNMELARDHAAYCAHVEGLKLVKVSTVKDLEPDALEAFDRCAGAFLPVTRQGA